MFQRIKESWRFLKRAPPGERFVRYHRRRQEGRSRAWLRPVLLVAGAVVVVVGVILMPAPGPGMLVVAGGLALMAGESLAVARALDGSERGARRLLARWRRRSS